jgi:transcriptional regulator with XRE-family HTH domain
MNMKTFQARYDIETGRILAANRKRLHMSQIELSRRIGVHRNTLRRWETGESQMPTVMLLRAADSLGCHYLSLLPSWAYVWPEGRPMHFEPGKPKPPAVERPIQWERDPPITVKERA